MVPNHRPYRNTPIRNEASPLHSTPVYKMVYP